MQDQQCYICDHKFHADDVEVACDDCIRVVFLALDLIGCGVDITFATPTTKEEPWKILDEFKEACRAVKRSRRKRGR